MFTFTPLDNFRIIFCFKAIKNRIISSNLIWNKCENQTKGQMSIIIPMHFPLIISIDDIERQSGSDQLSSSIVRNTTTRPINDNQFNVFSFDSIAVCDNDNCEQKLAKNDYSDNRIIIKSTNSLSSTIVTAAEQLLINIQQLLTLWFGLIYLWLIQRL